MVWGVILLLLQNTRQRENREKRQGNPKNEHKRINDPDREHQRFFNGCDRQLRLIEIQRPRVKDRTRNGRSRFTRVSRKKRIRIFNVGKRTLTSPPLTSSSSSATCVFQLQHSYNQNRKKKWVRTISSFSLCFSVRICMECVNEVNV